MRRCRGCVQDWARALAEIIELDYRDGAAVEAFLERSGFHAAE